MSFSYVVILIWMLTLNIIVTGFFLNRGIPRGYTFKKSKNDLIKPVFDDNRSVIGITLTRYMMETASANPQFRELESLLMAIQTACKKISDVIDHSFIDGITGLQGAINIQGEEQKKLDVITNDIMKETLRYTGKVEVIASEEEESPVAIANVDKYRDIGLRTTQFKSDVSFVNSERFVAVFDPLDGSSNVDAGIPTGTIFGIFDNMKSEVVECQLEDTNCVAATLQPGTNLVAAGYCLYSSSCFFCITVGNGLNIFTLDRHAGEFILTHPDVQIPKRGKIYSFNEGNRWEWDEPLREYVTNIQTGMGETGQKYSGRYIGSMVGDVHRTLLYGGIFGYPATSKVPNGKLRLLYEAAPMSFIVEQAGGLALTGKHRIMDVTPLSLHQRVPCILGSFEDVLEAKSYYDKCEDLELKARCDARINFKKFYGSDESVDYYI